MISKTEYFCEICARKFRTAGEANKHESKCKVAKEKSSTAEKDVLTFIKKYENDGATVVIKYCTTAHPDENIISVRYRI